MCDQIYYIYLLHNTHNTLNHTMIKWYLYILPHSSILHWIK